MTNLMFRDIPETYLGFLLLHLVRAQFVLYYLGPDLALDFIQLVCLLDDIVLSSAPSTYYALGTHSLSLNDNSRIILRSILTDSVSLLTLDFCFTLFDIGYSSGYVSADVRLG